MIAVGLCMQGYRRATSAKDERLLFRIGQADVALDALRGYREAMNRIFIQEDRFMGSEEEYARFLDAIRVLESCAERYRFELPMEHELRGSGLYAECGAVRVGYGAFKRFREALLVATPLDFQLEYQLWIETEMSFEDYPDWDSTPMRRRLWEFFCHPDCGGSWEAPKETAEMLGMLGSRLPDGTDVDLRLLDRMISLFMASDEVDFV